MSKLVVDRVEEDDLDEGLDAQAMSYFVDRHKKEKASKMKKNDGRALEMQGRHERREKEVQGLAKKFERRGARVDVKEVKNRKLKHDLIKEKTRQKEAAMSAARAQILQTEEAGYLEAETDMEKTYKVKQTDLQEMADVNTRAKMMDLKLEQFAPYRIDWTRNGRFLLMGGSKGHLSVIDGLQNKLQCEVFVQETVRDITFLHNQTMFAAAQKKYLFIYDETGAEVHRLRSHVNPSRLAFLPYHYLLASVGHEGWLKYQDVSTGELVSQHRTKLGPCDTITQNPRNAVVFLGHGNGTVTLWSPAVSKALVNVFCHGAPVKSIAVNQSGTEFVTAGLDGKLSVWDVRTYKRIHSYYTPRPATSIDISQTGLLSVSCGYQIQVWKDALRTKQNSPYMSHAIPGQEILHSKFRPFEDILGLGSTQGVSTVLIPGAGKANYDAFEANPFETNKQRREKDVRMLLEKLQPGTIMLDPDQIGTVDRTDKEILNREREEERQQNEKPKKEKNRMKGRNKIGNRLKRKHEAHLAQEREVLRAKLTSQADEQRSEKKQQLDDENVSALEKRFGKKN